MQQTRQERGAGRDKRNRISFDRVGVFLAICALEGIGALVGTLANPSEPGSRVLLGLSPARLAVTAGTAMLVALFVLLAWAARSRPNGWQKIENLVGRVSRSPARTFGMITAAFAVFLAILAVLILCVSPAAAEWTQLKTIYSRAGFLLAWAELILLQLGLLVGLDARTRAQIRSIAIPLRAGALLAVLTGVYTVSLKGYLFATWDVRLRGMERYIFIPAVILLILGTYQQAAGKSRYSAAIQKGLLYLFIGAFVYVIYWHTAQWAQFEGTRSSFTWHLLAQSFLEGRLYLENPHTFHDMTFYNGHWYIPSPPLPALILMPFVAGIGIERINMVHFSILCGALNAVIVYAMLAKASELKLIPTSTAGNLWLTALLALGTTHWWLSVYGIFWYLSQLLTLTFAGLAVVLALHKASPWYIGLCLGIAILSRPNIFTMWLLLAGITLYLEQERAGAIQWKKMFFWAVKSAVPVIGCVGLLLLYNFLRFENFMDFGYVTVNSASWIMDAVRTYGMFNIHFLPVNFYTMFLKMPTFEWTGGGLYYSPGGFEGTSILAMTPAMIFLFRRFKLNWWTIGAWLSVLLTAGMLLLYHNTGSWQLGYRYLMDFILPVLLLMAVGVGKRASPVFIALALLSILINAAGVNWWFTYM